ncbi:hypothetical protein BDN70DRAFT_873083 [Pholiota conissans]|uniref:Ubiquitin-like domain-containing protein n=1 Tax=Pholiota conissans TaxID=109636 RepID=A0A9P6D5E4_9AGAR|nr:hypothetical protein BDN70DRAFT_873083 [Pholiota conissans]
MSLVDIRVDLPSYSQTFTVRVPLSSSVSRLKQEIHHICPGQPRPDGQRLIWRGRVLSDDENIDNLWTADPRIVHLAVHPSAWSSLPPDIPHLPSQPSSLGQNNTFIRPLYAPPPNYAAHTRLTSTSLQPGFINHAGSANLRNPLAFVHYIHHKALYSLSSAIPPPVELPDNFPEHRLSAIEALERNGWSWPSFLDDEFPTPSEGGLVYDVILMEGQPYLQLSPASDGAIPTPLQEHALRILSSTFSILSMSTSNPPVVRGLHTQSVPIPPHVNQLLQQLGMPPLRAAGNNAIPANQHGQLLAELREIPIRPLIAPLMMLLFRTLLLLYFFAPARKPIFGVLILGWMLYEIWQPIRNGLRNGWGRRQENGQRQENNGRPAPAVGQPNVPQGPGPRLPGHPGPVAAEAQAAQLFDTLANLNLDDEQRSLNSNLNGPPPEPTLGHKIITFLCLFVTTLHPAIWNRRRVVLRRREGVVRTEANVRNAPPPAPDSDSNESPVETEAARRRELLVAQYGRYPRWIQRYMDRVVAEEWVDDSD